MKHVRELLAAQPAAAFTQEVAQVQLSNAAAGHSELLSSKGRSSKPTKKPEWTKWTCKQVQGWLKDKKLDFLLEGCVLSTVSISDQGE